MLVEDHGAFLDGDSSCLGIDRLGGDGNDHDRRAEHNEDSPLHAAEHCEEELGNEPPNKHIDDGADGLAGGASLEGEDLGDVKPSDRAG